MLMKAWISGVVIGFGVAIAGPSYAAPMNTATCVAFFSEHKELEKTGAKADLALDPNWAKVNLPDERFHRVLRYIVVAEGLKFRCPKIAMSGPGAAHNLPVRNPHAGRRERETTTKSKTVTPKVPELPVRKSTVRANNSG